MKGRMKSNLKLNRIRNQIEFGIINTTMESNRIEFGIESNLESSTRRRRQIKMSEEENNKEETQRQPPEPVPVSMKRVERRN